MKTKTLKEGVKLVRDCKRCLIDMSCSKSVDTNAYLPPDTGLQTQTACCPSSGSQSRNSSLLSQDDVLVLLSLDDSEKPETSEAGLQQLTAGLILLVANSSESRIEALAPGQISPLRSQG